MNLNDSIPASMRKALQLGASSTPALLIILVTTVIAVLKHIDQPEKRV
jgi:hypothetical protein